jgi:hypothetical protein
MVKNECSIPTMIALPIWWLIAGNYASQAQKLLMAARENYGRTASPALQHGRPSDRPVGCERVHRGLIDVDDLAK